MKTVDVNTVFIRDAKYERDTHKTILQFKHSVNFSASNKTIAYCKNASRNYNVTKGGCDRQTDKLTNRITTITLSCMHAEG